MSKRMMAMFVAVAVGVLQPAFGPVLQAQGPPEGIKVHGHWVIDVRNPDGTLSSHHEFENALTQGGQLLVSLLSRHSTFVGWSILLDSCAVGAQCRLEEPGVSGLQNVNVSQNLTVVAHFTDLSSRLDLSGSITAAQSISISRVTTFGRGILQAGGANGIEFTRRDLPTAIAVQQGQILQVSVSITFSS